MPESSNEKTMLDFVGIDEKRKRVCVSGHKDNFKATYVGGLWSKGYPEFDDLMGNYSEMKDKIRAEKYSLDARNFLKNFSS